MIERRLNELGRQGRTGVSAFERLSRAGIVESWLERRFVGVIRDARLPEPVLQRRYELDGVGVARVDFEYPLWGVIVEVGGQRGYLSLDERRRQERRRNALQLEGKTIYSSLATTSSTNPLTSCESFGPHSAPSRSAPHDPTRTRRSRSRTLRSGAPRSRVTRLPITGGTYTGIAATWARNELADDGSVAFIVELGATLDDDDAVIHADAVRTIAAEG